MGEDAYKTQGSAASAGDKFSDSDAIRGAGPLPHAQTVTFSDPLRLQRGGALPDVTVAYETYGTLNADRSNAVWICHALSGDSHVAAHDGDDAPGWWDIARFVGPGCPIDTDRYCVICPNILGGCRGTTGPGSVNPATGNPYGEDFPVVTVADMVELHRRLMRHLGIERLLAAVGGSMGGHQVLDWATRYSSEVAAAIPIATSPCLSTQALAFDVVARNAIIRDPYFNNGQYYDRPNGPDVGLALARMIGHITYLSREAMQEKFDADRLAPRDVPIEFEKEFSVGTYLGYQGTKFVERFDANSYIAISMAMDLFDLAANTGDLVPVFQNTQSRWLLISFTSDWLFSPQESRKIVDALLASGKRVTYCNVTSACGHDAFLLADDVAIYGELVRGLLADVSGAARTQPTPPPAPKDDPTSIFHQAGAQRLDYTLIANLIPAGAGVLDLGCGNGDLLDLLARNGHHTLRGVEIDEHAIIECVRRGLDVVHADLNEGLGSFADRQFDYVVLSRTLQAIKDVERVLADILRVGARAIVSFPNFGYHKLREMLHTQGRAPESSGILHHHWYNTPNIRVLTIADFEDFCAEKGLTIQTRLALDTEAGIEVPQDKDPNRNADLAIFVLQR